MRQAVRIGVGPLLVWAGVVGAAFGQHDLLQQMEDGFVALHDQVRPCVVNIETQSEATGMGDQLDEFFRYFGMPGPEDREPRHMPKARGTGSGFIYDKDGHIVTNNHVVEDADKITVRLWNGNEYEAKPVGLDPDTDLAVIKIEAEEDLPVARLGDSDALKVGQYAIAMGSPRGFEGSLSFGHISALGREGLTGLAMQGLRFQNLIQTDAAINLGNSGGPLCNIRGEVIGINIALVWGANSIAFAIPVNEAKAILPDLIASGKVTRGYLGVAIKDGRDLFDAVGLADGKGAFVDKVQSGTPADRAGIEAYDVIRKVDGQAIEEASDLVRKISSFPPGATVKVEVWRDGELIEFDVALDEWNPSILRPEREEPILGMRVSPLTPEMLERLGLDAELEGVVVMEIEPNSPAEEAGLTAGDIVIEVGRRSVGSPSELRTIVEEESEPGKPLLVRYVRGGSDPTITTIRVPE